MRTSCSWTPWAVPEPYWWMSRCWPQECHTGPWKKPTPCPGAWETVPTQALFRAAPTEAKGCCGLPPSLLGQLLGAIDLWDPASLIRFSFVFDPSKTRSGIACICALQHSWSRKQLNESPSPSPEFKIEKTESNAFFHRISKCHKAFCCIAAKESVAGFPARAGCDPGHGESGAGSAHATCRQRSRRGPGRGARSAVHNAFIYEIGEAREIHSTTTTFYSQRGSSERWWAKQLFSLVNLWQIHS